VRLYHRLDGSEDAPVLVLSNSIGTTLELWDPQVPALSRSFRLLRYDQLGHGRSEVPPGPYTVELLGRELRALLDDLEVERASFCGLSLGGAVGMWLGANAPERLDRLVLAGTSAYFGPPERWIERAQLVRSEGMEPVADAALGRWFTPAFAGVEPYRAQLLGTPPEGYAACCGAIERMDLRADLPAVTTPTLVVAGEHDPAAPPGEHARVIADGIPGAGLELVPAAHLANVEQPEAVASLIIDHLQAEGEMRTIEEGT
jgi:3-oxoadipate enol-lactonase